MVEIDWTEDDTVWSLAPGIYLAEIKDAKLKRSKKGDQMFEIRVAAVDWDGRHLFYDYLMLEGNGRSIGTRKLQGLGYEKGSDVDADDLVGKRFFAAAVEETSTYEGKTSTRMVADINAGDLCGYSPESAGRPATTLVPGEAYEAPTDIKAMADAFGADDGSADSASWDPFK